MPAIQQYALLVVVAIPVAVVLAMNLLLFFFGERGTLLLPRPGRYPRIELEDEPAPQAAAVGQPGIVVIEEAPLRKAA
jgi:hypothetical protein